MGLLYSNKQHRLEQDLDANSHKITSLADGTNPGDAVNLGQLTGATGSIIGLPDPSGEPDGEWLMTDTGAAVWVPAAANLVPIADAGNYFTGTDVEAALQELGAAPGGDVAADTHAAASKTTPVDADEMPLVDSAASFALKKLTWANLKATLKTYFDGIYASSGGTFAIVATDSIWDTAGDIVVATGADAAAKLALGTTGKVLQSNGSTVVYDYPPGREYDHTEITSPITVSATSFASPTTCITGGSVTYDGSTRLCIEAYTPLLAPGADDFIQVGLFDGSTQIGIILECSSVVSTSPTGLLNATLFGRKFYTPSAGSHQFLLRAIRGSVNGTFYGEAGTTTAREPAYLRITKA